MSDGFDKLAKLGKDSMFFPTPKSMTLVKENARLKERIKLLKESLSEITKAEGAFSKDPYKHAHNTIVNMVDIATKAYEADDEAAQEKGE